MLFKDFNLGEGFVRDWMHRACLGLVKNLLALWLNGEHIGQNISTLETRYLTVYNVILLCTAELGIGTECFIHTCMMYHQVIDVCVSKINNYP